MLTALILALGVAAIACVLAWSEHTHAREEARNHREVERDLLNRLQSRTLGEYVGATLATDDPLAEPLPDGWHTDDTGLISDPYWRDDRVP